MVNRVSLDVVNFAAEMKRVEREIYQLANDDIEGRIIFATKTLREVTPVDTGRARKGWKHKIERGFVNGETIGGTISNDVEYIDILNKGHSRQAPKFFIEQVLSRIGLISPS
jgi:hypothetical protein